MIDNHLTAHLQLIERLSNHDVLQSRAFSIAMRRINSNAFAEYVLPMSIIPQSIHSSQPVP